MADSEEVRTLSQENVRTLHGVRRALYVTAGLACVALAWVGWIVPGIPVTPFLLLASHCFVQSSPRLHRWLLRSPLFGPVLRDWQQHRGVRRTVKIGAVITLLIVVSLSVAFAPFPWYIKAIIAAAASIGLIVILLLPTLPDAPQR